nr:50S ribosomal protein L22 [Candidatus Sigynarchaeum springense]
MPSFNYSITGLNKDKSAIAAKRDAPVSFKKTREVCHHIKGMPLQKAKDFCERVINFTEPVPFKRYNKKVPHRAGHVGPGRWPIKSAKKVLELLKDVETNAEYKGIDVDKCRVIHCAVNQGRVIKKFIPRAHGRSSPYFRKNTHIEIAIVEE